MLLCLTIICMKNGDWNLWYGCLSPLLLVKFSEDCCHISVVIKKCALRGVTFTHWPWNYKSGVCGISMKMNQQRLHSAELTNHSSSTSTVLPHGCLCVLWHKLPGGHVPWWTVFLLCTRHCSSVCYVVLSFPLLILFRKNWNFSGNSRSNHATI